MVQLERKEEATQKINEYGSSLKIHSFYLKQLYTFKEALGGAGRESLKKHKQRTLKSGKIQFLSGVKERNYKIQCNFTKQGHCMDMCEITHSLEANTVLLYKAQIKKGKRGALAKLKRRSH